MGKIKIENGMRYWYAPIKRYVWSRGKIGNEYLFESAVGIHIRLTDEEVSKGIRINP